MGSRLSARGKIENVKGEMKKLKAAFGMRKAEVMKICSFAIRTSTFAIDFAMRHKL